MLLGLVELEECTSDEQRCDYEDDGASAGYGLGGAGFWGYWHSIIIPKSWFGIADYLKGFTGVVVLSLG